MKINSISLFSYSLNNNEYHNTSVQKRSNRPLHHSNKLNAMEFLGRSQVKFTGNESNEFDKAFFDDISKTLNLSNKDVHKFKKTVNRFLKLNNYSSLEEFCSSVKEDDDIDAFILNIADELDLDSKKVNILDRSITGKIFCSKLTNSMEEDESLSETFFSLALEALKNSVVCENLMNRFNLEDEERQNILAYLQKLNNDISPEQISYEITEEYGQNSIDDYNYVLKTIKTRDELAQKFLNNYD